MSSLFLRRGKLGFMAVLAIGLAIGCRHVGQSDCNGKAASCSTCSTSKGVAPAPATAVPAAPASVAKTAAPVKTYDIFPRVQGEKTARPPKRLEPGIAAAKKPARQLLPPQPVEAAPAPTVALPPAKDLVATPTSKPKPVVAETPVTIPSSKPKSVVADAPPPAQAPVAIPVSKPKTVVVDTLPPAESPAAIPTSRPKSVATELMPPSPELNAVTPDARPAFNHAPDYSFLTGKLYYSPVKKQWRLRYAQIDVEDRYGGSVTLDVHKEIQGFSDGQFVYIKGDLADRNSHGISPLYRVSEIRALKK